MALRVLVDSTYVLPAFGIAVKGLTGEDLDLLERLRVEGLVEYYYTPLMWVEIVPKVLRVYAAKGRQPEASLFERVAMALEATMRQVSPGPTALLIAAKLRVLGHADMIDNLLYGAAVEHGMLFLTMDKAFSRFLEKHGYDANRVLDHRGLIARVKAAHLPPPRVA